LGRGFEKLGPIFLPLFTKCVELEFSEVRHALAHNLVFVTAFVTLRSRYYGRVVL
jgi:hypothetical protein